MKETNDDEDISLYISRCSPRFLATFINIVNTWTSEFKVLFHLITFFFFSSFYLSIISMVAGFLDAIAKVRQFKFHNDDDLYDRLSRRFSVVLLMLFTVVVSTKQYVGDPIACFAPAQFTGK